MKTVLNMYEAHCDDIIASLRSSSKSTKRRSKSNLLYWGTTTPNITLDLKLAADQWTGSITGAYNPWKFPSYEREGEGVVHPKKADALVSDTKVKWWPCQSWEGHLWGNHAIYGQYNAGGIKTVKLSRITATRVGWWVVVSAGPTTGLLGVGKLLKPH